jgi:hypothetical protein
MIIPTLLLTRQFHPLNNGPEIKKLSKTMENTMIDKQPKVSPNTYPNVLALMRF